MYLEFNVYVFMIGKCRWFSNVCIIKIFIYFKCICSYNILILKLYGLYIIKKIY